MPPERQVSVELRPDGRWAVQMDGTQRADSLHDKKPAAHRPRSRTRREQACRVGYQG